MGMGTNLKEILGSSMWALRPLHTRAKSRDHEIVRALVRAQKMSKGRPKTPPKSCSVVTDPQV